MARYDIDVRLAKLGKKSVDVVKALLNKGTQTNPQDFSRYKSGVLRTPKAELVLSEADKIITMWEGERNGKKVP